MYKEDCWPNTHKVLIFLDTILFFIHGFIGVLYGGFWIALIFSVQVLLQYDVEDPDQDFLRVRKIMNIQRIEPIYDTVTGAIEIYLSLLVCCASCCELKTMLRALCLVCGIFVVQNIVFLSLAAADLETLAEADGSIHKVLLYNFVNLYNVVNGTDPSSRFTFEMNGIQVLLKCCGVHDYRDYTNATAWTSRAGRNFTVPETCCHLNIEAYLFLNVIIFPKGPCMTNPTPNNSNSQKGCAASLLVAFETQLMYLSVMWTTLSMGLHLFTIGLFCCQLHASGKETEDPFATLRDGRFLDETDQIVQQMSMNEMDMRAPRKTKTPTDTSLAEKKGGESEEGGNIFNVILNLGNLTDQPARAQADDEEEEEEEEANS